MGGRAKQKAGKAINKTYSASVRFLFVINCVSTTLDINFNHQNGSVAQCERDCF